MALDPHVLEAVDGVAGLERRRRVARRRSPGRPGRASEPIELEVLGRDVARRVERLAVGEDELGAGGTEVVEADPAVDVLARGR